MGLKLQTLTLPDPTFLESYICNSDHTFRYPFITSLQIMALRRSVMKDDILCELYAGTYSGVSDDCETEILGSESETSTVRGRK